jgi:hypothetical protein
MFLKLTFVSLKVFIIFDQKFSNQILGNFNIFQIKFLKGREKI